MTRTSAASLAALIALATAVACSALLAWVLLEPRDWFSGAYEDEETIASLRAELADTRRDANLLRGRIRKLEEEVADGRPQIRAVGALCYALRNVDWPSDSAGEYAIVVTRALVDGLGESCDWAGVPETSPHPR